jgi:fructose-1,6-bisphosphatase I/sedoheptulose-1,7-bisphosphatase
MIGPRPTLARYLQEWAGRHPSSGPAISTLLTAVATAATLISDRLERGALADALGSAGLQNVQGEVQKNLDVISNDLMVQELLRCGQSAALASEEVDELIPVPEGVRRGEYLVAFDPLDGSSNIDVNLTVGTIFSILHSPRPGAAAQTADFLQPGTAQVAAGFALYGPSTLLVLTTGEGVDAFTLDRDTGHFVLTHPQLRIPSEADEFAINTSNERFWEPPVHQYVGECLAGATGPRGRDVNMRWVASLVADAFRILTRGGVYLYPLDSRRPIRAGRLRLTYECNPIAFVIEQAGGMATTGRQRILDVEVTGLHQRIPFIFGSASEVERIERMHREHDRDDPAFDASLFNTRSLFRAG